MKIQKHSSFRRNGYFFLWATGLKVHAFFPILDSQPYWAQILAWSASKALSRSCPGPLRVECVQSMLGEPGNQLPFSHNGRAGCGIETHNTSRLIPHTEHLRMPMEDLHRLWDSQNLPHSATRSMGKFRKRPNSSVEENVYNTGFDQD